MERRDLVVKKQPVKVCEEISNLLGIGRDLDINYDYTYICRSVSDPNRISGIPFKTIVSHIFSCDLSQQDFDQSYDSACNHMIVTDNFRMEKGINLKIGRFAAAVFPDKTAQEVALIGDRWGNLLRQSSSADLSVLQVSSTPSEIYGGYCGNFSSCMNNQDESWFEIYDDLEDTEILYILEGKQLLGRALLHNKVHSAIGDIKVMDRIYSSDADKLALFVQYAVKNGYFRKQFQALNCDTYIDPNTSEIREDLNPMWIECDDLTGKYVRVPYVDTFCHYHGDCLSTSSYLNGRHCETTLRETCGTDSDFVITEPNWRCVSCNEAIDEDDGIYVDGYGQLCDGCAEDYHWCECCDNYIHAENVVMIHSQAYCGYHAEHDFTLCCECDEYHSPDDCEEVYDYGLVCSSCRQSSRFFQCDDCGNWFPTRYENSTQDGSICDSCFEANYTRCHECEEHFENGEMKEYGNKWFCQDCYESVLEEEVEA